MCKKNAFLIAALCVVTFQGVAQEAAISLDDYITGKAQDQEGHEIIGVIVPGKPPATYRAPAASPSSSSILLQNVPAFVWSFGCSSTSAAMAAGYYDNNGYPEIYTGPTNEGVMPMDNSCWGMVTINEEQRNQCPLSATMEGLDARQTRGHVDDYWISTYNYGSDPYIANGWVQHEPGDCLGDFMGTNQSAIGNADGITRFFFFPDGSPLYDYTGTEPVRRDGCHGLRLFYQSRGYTVVENYTQLIKGMYGNSIGFTFDQYEEEIDNGRPVVIQVSGHSMLGFGYEEPNIVFLHDTWDYEIHSMVWGGSYAGLAQWGVTVIRLESGNSPPLTDFSANLTTITAGQNISFTDQSSFDPTNWQWNFEGGYPSASSEQNPIVVYSDPGTYLVRLVAANSNGYDSKTKFKYIKVTPEQYCAASGGCLQFIRKVHLGDLDNVSNQCGTDGYSDFTSLDAGMAAGQKYILRVYCNYSIPDNSVCMAWIDWNHDLDFDNPNESYYMSYSGDSSYSALIIPPAGVEAGNTRMRIRIAESGNALSCGSSGVRGEVEDYTVHCIQASESKIVNLTFFLEGLYDPPAGMMNKAHGNIGGYYPGAVADVVDITLRASEYPYTIVSQCIDVSLYVNGTCSAAFPVALDGSYYIVVKHRNSIETWTASPVSFDDPIIELDFSCDAGAAYGSNLKNVNDTYCVYGGDCNQDGNVDQGDMNLIENLVSNFASGYLPEDVNGDGMVDVGDIIMLDNDASIFICKKAP
jgi:PKD repeat protein